MLWSLILILFAVSTRAIVNPKKRHANGFTQMKSQAIIAHNPGLKTSIYLQLNGLLALSLDPQYIAIKSGILYYSHVFMSILPAAKCLCLQITADSVLLLTATHSQKQTCFPTWHMHILMLHTGELYVTGVMGTAHSVNSL